MDIEYKYIRDIWGEDYTSEFFACGIDGRTYKLNINPKCSVLEQKDYIIRWLNQLDKVLSNSKPGFMDTKYFNTELKPDENGIIDLTKEDNEDFDQPVISKPRGKKGSSPYDRIVDLTNDD